MEYKKMLSLPQLQEETRKYFPFMVRKYSLWLFLAT